MMKKKKLVAPVNIVIWFLVTIIDLSSFIDNNKTDNEPFKIK